jgi:hypothetical protein
MLNEYLLEPFMAQYFLIDAVCRSYMSEDDRIKVYNELARVFCLDCEETEALYNESRKAHFDSITDLSSYGRLCRTVEFATGRGESVELTPTDTLILSCKRQAMTVKSQLFQQEKNLTRETITDTLIATATKGSVDAMALLSFMEYHGICVPADRVNAVKRLRLCAKWNSLFGNLMGIAYDPDRAPYYLNVIGTVSRTEGQKRAYERICQRYGKTAEFTRDPVARMIDKAFGLGIIKRSTYDQFFARIAFSELISCEDKAKVLLNNTPETIKQFTELPFDAKRGGRAELELSAADEMPVRREDELERILRSLAVAQTCPAQVRKPLLIVSDDALVGSFYEEMILKLTSTLPTLVLDGGTLTERDFDGSKENVLLRGIGETGRVDTYFIIKDLDELESRPMDELIKVIDNKYRARLKLFAPAVCLDLSEARFVLLASERSREVTRLACYCDTVYVDRLRGEERTEAVEHLFRRGSEAFGLRDMTLTEEGKSSLIGLNPNRLAVTVDSLLRRAVYTGEHTVTEEDVKDVCADEGFAPARRGFGYTGGDHNA